MLRRGRDLNPRTPEQGPPTFEVGAIGRTLPPLPLLWSRGESNPRPAMRLCCRYDHSRVSGSRLPRRRVASTARSLPLVPSVLSRRQPVCPCCHLRFCCRAALIRPRVPSLVAVALGRCLPQRGSRRRERDRRRRLLGAPLKSLGNSGRGKPKPVPQSKPVGPEMEETVGFKPTTSLEAPVFKTGAFVRSATSPCCSGTRSRTWDLALIRSAL